MTAGWLLLIVSLLFAAGFVDRGKWEQRAEGDKFNRVYSVYTPDLDWDAMVEFARAKKHSGPGTTTIVCFFGDWRNTPDVTFTGINFSEYYKEHWVAGYWFNADGGELFVQYPAKSRMLV